MPTNKQTTEEAEHQKLEDRLDQELEDSFPASDAPKVTRSPITPAIDKLKNEKDEPGEPGK